jgi:FtsP/CotA-like multicopper oxidase with cupredoxin domain
LLSWLAAVPLVALSIAGAEAQVSERAVSNPPTLGVQQGVVPRITLQAAPPAARMTTKKSLDLDVDKIHSKLYNPSTGQDDNVYLRGYTGAGVNPNAPFVAPTIEINPGDTVDITLHNKLKADPSCIEMAGMDMNPDKPHCFNGTNLHSHGLWVSPTGNSDNVLISINPGVSFQYEYNVPPDHPAGTFWYHTHRHGSTALQVASGMAGALIIRGERLPTADAHGDIDTILKNRDGTPLTERILVLQQIAYACLDAEGNIKVRTEKQTQPDGTVKDVVVAWVCDSKDTGVVEFYADKNNRGLGPQDWKESGRYTSINGVVQPTFKAKQGDIERWRLIHGGIRDTIQLQFFKLKPGATAAVPLTSAATAQFIGDNCTGNPLYYQVIASDGLTMAAAPQTAIATLQPGYRSDALVLFPEAGTYCIVNAQVSAASSVTRSASTPRLIGFVDVAPTEPFNQDIRLYIINTLAEAAQKTAMPPNVRDAVIADLQNDFHLTQFTPHRDIADDEVKGRQFLTFYIDVTTTPPKFEVSSAPFDKPFEPQPYDPTHIDRYLTLGSADEWQLQSRFVSHPYHIHVNPFQIVKILDPNGKDVSAPGAVDDAGGTPDPQYPGLKGVWKDTLWVKSLVTSPDNPYPKGIYTIVIRTRYERYIGEYVLHCHILDHEDQGMMQNVRIDLPDGQGGTAGLH